MIPFSAAMIGRSIVATNTSGGARISTARSGTENDRFFGIISPTTTCRNETSSSAIDEADRADHLLAPAGQVQRLLEQVVDRRLRTRSG